MKIPFRDTPHRWKLDRQYLDSKRQEMIGCPQCGRTDGLKCVFNASCNMEIICTYHIKCENCGYEPKEWYDNVADAVLIFDMEARNILEQNK